MRDPAIPPNARGAVRASSFWTEPTDAARERWRTGWWHAYDQRRPASEDASYLRGRAEYLEHFAAQESPMTETDTRTATCLRLDQVDESPLNYRKTFDQVKLDELTESVRKHGVLQPILARPLGDRFEVVCGARRVRAAARAGLEAVPAVVRPMSDAEAMECMVVENGQRDDVPPLEEAEGFARLLALAHYREEDVAARVGKGVQYVSRRLRLLKLTPAARKHLEAGRITLSVAELLARIPDEAAQDEATKAVLPRWKEDPPRAVSEAKRVILGFHTHPLRDAIFDVADADLVPGVGACAACPHRAGNQPRLFGDDVDADTCTKPSCWSRKLAAHQARAIEAARARGLEVVKPKGVFADYGRNDCPVASSKHQLLTEPAYHVGESRTWKQLLGKSAPPPVAVVTAPSGRVVEVWDRDELVKAAKAKGVRVKGTAAARPAGKSPTAVKAEKVRAAATRRAIEALVDAAECADATVLWQPVAEAVIGEIWADTLKKVASRRGLMCKPGEVQAALRALVTGAESPHALIPSEIQGLVVELLASRGDFGEGRGWPSRIELFAEALGVDLEKVRSLAEKEVLAEISAGRKPKGKTTVHRTRKPKSARATGADE